MHLTLRPLRADTPDLARVFPGLLLRGFLPVLLIGLVVGLFNPSALAQAVTLATALDQSDLVVSTSGDATWFGQTKVSHDGISAAQSGAITAGKSTSMSIVITGVSKFSFRWRTSSEKGRDYLRFYIDDREQTDALSGERDWRLRTFTVSASESHTLRWTYSKDGVFDFAKDAGWVDDFTILESVAVAEKQGRTLRGMGDSSQGQLGLETVPQTDSPQKIVASVSKVSAGGAHSLFIKTNASLWGMGDNQYGQLGTATTTDHVTPVQIVTNVTQASAGRAHSLFIKTDGSLWAMGDNSHGQLGDNSLTLRTAPVQIATGVTQVAAGARHSLFIKTDGSLWAMGDNTYGQLGDGTTTQRTVPVQIANAVAQVAAGAFHTLFIKTDGSLYAVGKNDSGQLGDGTTNDRSAPTQIATAALRVATGETHSLFTKTDSALWTMGGNAHGQLGTGDTTNRLAPAKIATAVNTLAAGIDSSFFIKSDGSLWAMGLNENGQLGDDTTADRSSAIQIATGVVDVAAGERHTLFLQPSAVFTVTFKLGDHGTRTGGGTLVQTVGEGTAAVAPTLQAKSGWVFKTWDVGFDSVSSALTINAIYSQTQTITFNAPPDPIFTPPAGGSIELTASASSGLPVTFEVVSGPATLAANGTTLTYTDIGTVVIKATQAGNDTYGAAIAVTRNVVIKGTPQTITFEPPASKTYGDAPFNVTASTDAAGLVVTIRVVSGPATLAADGRTLTLTGAGSVVLEATQAGGTAVDNARYAAATAKTRTLVVAKKTLTVLVEDATRSVGEPNPAFVVNYTGFVGADTATAPGVITTAPTVASKATPSSAPGAYPVAVSGGLATNYQFSPSAAAATLTVIGYGGDFEALLTDSDTIPIGKISISVPANSLKYTGTLSLASEIAPVVLRGTLTPAIDSLSANHTFNRAASSSLPELTVSINLSASELTGTVNRAGANVGTLADGVRLTLPEGSLGAGAHTLTLRPGFVLDEDDVRAIPAGSGYASAKIDPKTSAITVTGKLADATKLTASLKLASDRSYRFWAQPYAKRMASYVAGRLALQPHPEPGRYPTPRFYIPDESETFLVWQKAPSPAKPLDKSYRAGFGPLAVPVTLDPWLAPATKATVINGVSLPAGTLAQRLDLTEDPLSPASLAVAFGPADLNLGASTDLLPTSLSLSAKGLFSVAAPTTTPLNATRFSLKLTPATGAFSGSFTLSDVRPPATKPTLRKVPFFGTLRQAPEGDPNLGAGFFLLPDFDKAAEQPSAELILSR